MPLHEEKQNLCNASGECTGADKDEEKTCPHAVVGVFYHRGGCILRHWTGDCNSPKANEEAKKESQHLRGIA